MRVLNLVSWALRGIVALIFIQSLFFKFSAAPESVQIFSTVGKSIGFEGIMEPWGRIGVGVAELIASVLLFVPGMLIAGAVLSTLIAAGAIGSHLFTELGIVVQGDGGMLFILGIVVFICSTDIIVLEWIQRRRSAQE